MRPTGGATGCFSSSGASATRSGREASTALTAATVMIADADQRVHAQHGWQRGAERDRVRHRELDARGGGAHHHGEPGDDADDTQESHAHMRHGLHRRGDDQAGEERAEHAHVEDVGAERRDAAVGEREGLHGDHHGHHEAREPRAEQHGGERRPEEVAAGAADDREVEHLGREDEGGEHAQQRHARLVQLHVRDPQGVRHGSDREHATGERHATAQEAIRDVEGYRDVEHARFSSRGFRSPRGRSPRRDRGSGSG